MRAREERRNFIVDIVMRCCVVGGCAVCCFCEIVRLWRIKSERLCCFRVLSHSDGAMSWCNDLSLFDDRCIDRHAEFTRGQNDELVRSHAGFADVALSDVADKRVMKKRSHPADFLT